MQHQTLSQLHEWQYCVAARYGTAVWLTCLFETFGDKSRDSAEYSVPVALPFHPSPCVASAVNEHGVVMAVHSKP